MTTIVVARKGSKACIGADSLAKYGSTLEHAGLIENSEKLVGVGGAWLGPTGPASAQLLLTSYFGDPEHRADFSSAQGIFETLIDLQGTLKDQYFLNPREDERDPFDSMQMELLIASPAGIFGAYPLRSVQEYSRYYAFGSGAEYALGAMFTAYDGAPDARSVVEAGLQAAAELDDSTAGPHSVRELDLTP